MKRRTGLVALLLVAGTLAACGSGASGERRVLVDYSSDEFASSAFYNYPSKIDATPGQTVVFKQTWTGEPHTVTGGTFAQKNLRDGKAWLEFFNAYDSLRGSGADLPDPENAGDAPFSQFTNAVKNAKDAKLAAQLTASWKALIRQGVPLPDLDNPPKTTFADVGKLIEEESEKAFSDLKFAFDDDDSLAQNLAQPCFRRSEGPPAEASKACPKADQRQPEFDGTQTIYNSGVIRYDGPQGNSFNVKLADDIKPGAYLFYCAVHGPGQLTEVNVRPKGTKLASSTEVARRGRAEADKAVVPLRKVYNRAVRTGRFALGDDTLKAPFAGLFSSESGHLLINEFVPQEMRVKANEPITWTMLGSDHTISFDVPKYFPILQFDTAKGVQFNPKLQGPQGGAPALPEGESDGPRKFDGGTYDGNGFWSSGLFGGQPYGQYTVRISKPGTYPYACLIHPRMIGRITVT